MNYVLGLTRRRGLRLLAASARVVGAGGSMMAASSAPTVACAPGTFLPGCTMTGTATVSGGALGVAAPATQSWATQLNGIDKQLVDTADDSFTVQDITGSGDGWTVTATATQFVGAGDDGNTLADTGTLVYNGSTTSET